MDNPTNKGGRPPFKPTPKQREQVMNMIATGANLTETAAVIGIDTDTLNKYFPEEIATAKARKRCEWISWLVGSAKPTGENKGNVAAQKALLTLVVLDDPAPGEDARPRTGQLGKKEVAQKQAESAAIGLYETPAPPGKGSRTVQ